MANLWTANEVQLLHKMRKQGASIQEIAKRLKSKIKRERRNARKNNTKEQNGDITDAFGVLSGDGTLDTPRATNGNSAKISGKKFVVGNGTLFIPQSPKYKISVRGSSLHVKTSSSAAVTVVVLGDIHFPFEDPSALALARVIIKEAKPDIVILNGDVVDFFGISKFPVPPIRRAQFAQEVKYAAKQIRKIREWAPDALWIYNEGNHELRMQLYLWRRAPEMSELLCVEDELELAKSGIIYLKQAQEPQLREDFVAPQVVLGKLYVLHGHTVRMWGNAVNVARGVFQRLLKPTLIGHWHRKDIYIQTDYEGVPSGAFVHGCLARPRPHWDTGRIWGQGMAVITLQNGYFECDVLDFILNKDENKLFTLWRGQKYEIPMS